VPQAIKLQSEYEKESPSVSPPSFDKNPVALKNFGEFNTLVR
jgi:hypothetical protein